MKTVVKLLNLSLITGALCLRAGGALAGLVTADEIEAAAQAGLIAGAPPSATGTLPGTGLTDPAPATESAFALQPSPAAPVLARPLAASGGTSFQRVSTVVDLSLWAFVNIVLGEQGNRPLQMLQAQLRAVELASTDLPAAVPLPGSAGLFLLGAVGLGAVRLRALRRRRRPA